MKNYLKVTDKHKMQSSAGALSKNVFKNFAKFTEKKSLLESGKLQAGNLKLSEAATGDLLLKKDTHKIFSSFTGKHLCWSFF